MNRNPRLQPVRHAQLVLNDEQSVQKRLGLEVERVVDVVLRAPKFVVVSKKHICGQMSRVHTWLHLVPHRAEKPLKARGWE